MPQEKLDLAGIFGAVTKTLIANQQPLNQADIYNQDHGDNMVQTFQTITDALQRKKGASTSKALSYAAQLLSKNTSSSSSQLYAQNLDRASTQFKGKTIDAMGALSLLQTLIGGGQANQSSSGDVLGTLLGNLAQSGNSPVQSASQPGGAGLLGSLLGSLGGGTSPSAQAAPQASSGDLLGSLLGGALGGSSGGLETLVQSLLGGSGMGDASHRTQSTQLVISAFLQAINALKK